MTATNEAYEKIVQYRFRAAGEVWLAERFNATSISIEEARKNGQEDTHMYLTLVLKDGVWVACAPGAGEAIMVRLEQEGVDEIVAYVNDNGAPGDG